MILSNASISDGLRNFTRMLTNTNTTTYSSADLDASLNTYYDLFVTEIINSMDEWDFQADYATTNLVASQQEYILPTDILKIKKVEITYDGTTWYTVNPKDINERTGTNDTTTIGEEFDEGDPFFDLMDNSLFLYPIPTIAVTSGLKVYYEKLPTQLSNVTDEPGFARPFHKGLSYGAAKDFFEKYLEKEGNANKLTQAENNMLGYLERMKGFYRRRNQDRVYEIVTNDTDYEYGQN